MQNFPLPDWVSKPTLAGYPPKDLETAVRSYGEAHQIICAGDPDCARMMAGLWLDQILTALQQKRDGKLPDRTANVYAAHTETVLSLIRLFQVGILEMKKVKGWEKPTSHILFPCLPITKVPDTEVKDNPNTAGVLLEYRDQPQPSVRFIFPRAWPQ